MREPTFSNEIARINKQFAGMPHEEPETDEWCTTCKEYDNEKHCCPRFNKVIRGTMEEIQAERKKDKWIPFTYRTPTEGEKEDHPDWDYILDCKLPEDGQRILVTIEQSDHEPVQLDEFYCDSDGCYLDSGYGIGYGEEAIAWMPLPEPWKGEQDETD